jgi:hypothetical protein
MDTAHGRWGYAPAEAVPEDIEQEVKVLIDSYIGTQPEAEAAA